MDAVLSPVELLTLNNKLTRLTNLSNHDIKFLERSEVLSKIMSDVKE
jgi:hypothetical protein